MFLNFKEIQKKLIVFSNKNKKLRFLLKKKKFAKQQQQQVLFLNKKNELENLQWTSLHINIITVTVSV